MNSKQHQQIAKDRKASHPALEAPIKDNKVKSLNPNTPLFLPNRVISHHHPKAGINVIVDAAGYLFLVMGKLKQFKSYKQLNKLHAELVQAVNGFYDSIKNQQYPSEFIIVCRYLLCATLDEIIFNTPWGGCGRWETYSLLQAFNQNTQHQDKFFNIIERAIKEPAIYIDLMELMFLCLSMGYKGKYRNIENNPYQLEQITNHLYKHIRAYRGTFSKILSPPLITTIEVTKKSSEKKTSPFYILTVTACVIMTLFLSLGYIMDIISNEAYQNFAQMENIHPHKTSR